MVSILQDSIAYVYVLIDPRDSTPFYVGQTNNPTARMTGHLSDGRKCRVIGLGTKPSMIREILDANLEPIMRIIEVTTAKYVSDREFNWYEAFIQRGYKITGEVLQPVERSETPQEAPVQISMYDYLERASLEMKLNSIKSKSARALIINAIREFMGDVDSIELKKFIEAGESYIRGGF